MKIIAFANQKGGVGKTTSVLNVGAGLVRQNKNVLLVDCDPQGHLTHCLGFKEKNIEYSLHDLLIVNEAPVKTQGQVKRKLLPPSYTLKHRFGLTLIPSSAKLARIELTLTGVPGAEHSLRDVLKSKKDFDYILIDCPPALGTLTINAFVAATSVYIPITAEYLSIHGITRLIDLVKTVRSNYNRKVEVSGIIITRFDKHKKMNQDVLKLLKKHLGNIIFKNLIRENVAVAEAPNEGKPIFEFQPRSNGTEDYYRLSREIIRREENPQK